MLRITEVVKMLLIINVVVYFGSTLILGEQEAYWFLSLKWPGTEGFAPYQLASHMFMHFGTTHLFFNMFGLFMFGPPLEMAWGPKRFLFYYLMTGFGAMALHMLITYFEIQNGGSAGQMAGASGAIFGLLAGYGMLYPNSKIMLLIPPIPMKAKYFVLIYGAIELFLGVSNLNTGIAHFAHLGGAITGFLLIIYWRKFGSRL